MDLNPPLFPAEPLHTPSLAEQEVLEAALEGVEVDRKELTPAIFKLIYAITGSGHPRPWPWWPSWLRVFFR